MKWREMFKLAVDAARTEAKLQAERVGDWLAESPVAPSSPAPQEFWHNPTNHVDALKSDRCLCGEPKGVGRYKCKHCEAKS